MLHELRRLPQFRYMSNALYYTYAHRLLEHHFTRAVVRVAYPAAWEEDGKTYSGNTRHIVGFIIAEPSNIGLIVHYLYTRMDYQQDTRVVKSSYRRQGIAKALLKGMMDDYGLDRVVYTVRSQDIQNEELLMDKVAEWSDPHDGWLSFNHFLFWTLLPDEWERGIVAMPNKQTKDAYRLQEDAVPANIWKHEG